MVVQSRLPLHLALRQRTSAARANSLPQARGSLLSCRADTFCTTRRERRFARGSSRYRENRRIARLSVSGPKLREAGRGKREEGRRGWGEEGCPARASLSLGLHLQLVASLANLPDSH